MIKKYKEDLPKTKSLKAEFTYSKIKFRVRFRLNLENKMPYLAEFYTKNERK